MAGRYRRKPSAGKRVAFHAIMVAIPLVALLLAVVGYYAVAKLTYPAYACGSFARLDGEIGWVLKPDAASCLGGRKAFSSAPPWFEGSVHTDSLGLRAPVTGGEPAPGGILVVGDSWSFGYGVSFEQSYGGQLAAQTGLPVAIAASPAYSTAQAVLLAERAVKRVRPRAIVLLDRGMWERATCRGTTRPTTILKPCYWQAPGMAEADLVLPAPGLVERRAAWGQLPGGMVGAGETSWAYFTVSRPLALVNRALVMAGLVSGPEDDFFAKGVDRDAMRRAAMRQIGGLAETAGVPLLLLDPDDVYADLMARLPPTQAALIHRVGSGEWNEIVVAGQAGMAESDHALPNDGHFGPGANRLVAELIAARMRRAGWLEP